MNFLDINVSAYRGDSDEPYRIDRLNAMLGAIAALCDVEAHDLRSEIGLMALHDHKGNLSVGWVDISFAYKYMGKVAYAWGLFGEVNSEHHVQHQDRDLVIGKNGVWLMPEHYPIEMLQDGCFVPRPSYFPDPPLPSGYIQKELGKLQAKVDLLRSLGEL